MNNDYYKKLYKEYDKDPEAFENRTKYIHDSTKELVKSLNKFGKEVDEFLKEK